MSSELIRSLQEYLAIHGFNPGPIDGLEGPQTMAAWMHFMALPNISGSHGTVLYVGSGRATIFGLNYDGTTDPTDNGQGFFGYDTTDKTLHGVSLPVATLDSVLGLFGGNVARLGANIVENDPRRYIVPSIEAAIGVKQYVVSVANTSGVTDPNCPIVDIGPASWTGNEIDLTYATAHALSTGGDAQVTFSIIKV